MVACEAAMVAQYGNGPNKVGNGFGVLFLFLFVTFYGGCVDAISYVYCSELFPTNLRAQGMGFSVMGLFAMTLRKLLSSNHSLESEPVLTVFSVYPDSAGSLRFCWLEILPCIYHCAIRRCPIFVVWLS